MMMAGLLITLIPALWVILLGLIIFTFAFFAALGFGARLLAPLLLLLAVLLGAYTGFLLSALKTYPLLNNPVLPVLFLIPMGIRHTALNPSALTGTV